MTADGSTVLFVRTASGVERAGMLWAYDVAAGTERLLADPSALLGARGEELSDAERSRRERARESGAGIVGYSIDNEGRTAVFALSGGLWVCDVQDGSCRRLPVPGPAVDPRIDPTGSLIGYVCGSDLRVVGVDGSADRTIAADQAPTVVWGQAEFAAAEEMDRPRGYWWAPDGRSLLVERYDDAAVTLWYVADPAHPERQPAAHRYPAAGTANADVSLWHIAVDGARRRVAWDSVAFPYLARVSWIDAGAIMQVLSRDQRRSQVLRLPVPAGAGGAGIADVPGIPGGGRAADSPARDDATLSTVVVAEATDADWVELVVGLPALAPDGRLLTAVDDHDGVPTRRLAVDGAAVSPPGLQLLTVLDSNETGVLATVSADPVEQHLALLGYDGTVRELSAGLGVHSGALGGGTVVVASSRSTAVDTDIIIRRLDGPPGETLGRVRSLAEPAPFTPDVTLLTVGDRDLRAALVLPRGHESGSARLPVIMAPYGGPHAQLVRASARLFLQAQWLADQGFAVVVADGRGTPARGPAWERAVHDELAAVTVSDQVDALAGVAARYPDDLDTSRVGIMGWSYGGYLAALAVLDRPDVFHAAVAGAPVTDWTLYDTCYTERYLGDPAAQPDVYRRNSLLERAARLRRPLLLIHGTVDDNVVFAHTLRLSAALLAAGRPHQVLPLTGMTHMASDEVVAENLMRAHVDFFRRALR